MAIFPDMTKYIPDGPGWSPDGGEYWVRDGKVYWEDGTVRELSKSLFRTMPGGYQHANDYSAMITESDAIVEPR